MALLQGLVRRDEAPRAVLIGALQVIADAWILLLLLPRVLVVARMSTCREIQRQFIRRQRKHLSTSEV